MQRVTRSTAVAIMPDPPAGGTPGYFGPGNPVGGVLATIPGHEWFNSVQEELAAVIAAAGIALDVEQTDQLLAALNARYAPLASPTFTGNPTAPTPAAGDNDTSVATTAFVAAAVAANYQTLIVSDTKAQNTHAGASVAGVQTRVLNTVEKNTIAGASLASNQITLPAGTYSVLGFAPAYNVNGHRAHLYSVTDSATLLIGSNENSTTTAAGDGVGTKSAVLGDITLAATKVLELRHYTTGIEASWGLGLALNVSGTSEIYSKIQIIKRG